MARRRGSSARGSRTVKNNVWTTVIAQELVVAASAQLELNIAQPSDWAFGVGQRATLLTVRGYISICAALSDLAAVEGAVLWYIAPVDADISTAQAPQLAPTYIEEDILTTGGHIFENFNPNNASPGRMTKDWDVNIKTMRKLPPDTTVRFVLANRTSDDIKITSVMRALLRKGGN